MSDQMGPGRPEESMYGAEQALSVFLETFPHPLPDAIKELIRSGEIDPVVVTMEELATLSGPKRPIQKKDLERRFIALTQLELHRLGGLHVVMPWGDPEWIEPGSTSEFAPDELLTLTKKDVGTLSATEQEPKDPISEKPREQSHVSRIERERQIENGEIQAAPYELNHLQHLNDMEEPLLANDLEQAKRDVVLTRDELEALDGFTVKWASGVTEFIDPDSTTLFDDEGLLIIRKDQLWKRRKAVQLHRYYGRPTVPTESKDKNLEGGGVADFLQKAGFSPIHYDLSNLLLVTDDQPFAREDLAEQNQALVLSAEDLRSLPRPIPMLMADGETHELRARAIEHGTHAIITPIDLGWRIPGADTTTPNESLSEALDSAPIVTKIEPLEQRIDTDSAGSSKAEDR